MREFELHSIWLSQGELEYSLIESSHKKDAFPYPLNLELLLLVLKRLDKKDVVSISTKEFNLEEILNASQHLTIISRRQPSVRR